MNGSRFLGPAAMAIEGPWTRRKRLFRWKFFRIVFVLTYIGIVLDVITTSWGYALIGSRYEQNPLGSSLIGSLGWLGLLGILTLLSLVCYISVRTVFWRMALGWTVLLNVLICCVAAVRWLAVVTALMFIAHPS